MNVDVEKKKLISKSNVASILSYECGKQTCILTKSEHALLSTV